MALHVRGSRDAGFRGRRAARKSLGTVLMLAGLALLPVSLPGAAPEEPIWTFDFRLTFYDVTFRNAREAVLVGSRGHILASHAQHPNLWSPRDSGAKEVLTSLSFADEQHGWVAGHRGLILHTEDGGRSWTTQRPAADKSQPLFDIQFVSKTVGFACGAYDTFLKTVDGGRHWTEAPTGYDYIYNGLAFRNSREGYLVGEFGTVLHTADAGGSWEKLDLVGYTGSLFGIELLDSRSLLVFGIAGKIFRSENHGRHWQSVAAGISSSLFRAAVSGNAVVLVGGSGVILLSTDGGRSFQKRLDHDLIGFAGVCPHPGGGFLCVGEVGKILRVETQPLEKPRELF